MFCRLLVNCLPCKCYGRKRRFPKIPYFGIRNGRTGIVTHTVSYSGEFLWSNIVFRSRVRARMKMCPRHKHFKAHVFSPFLSIYTKRSECGKTFTEFLMSLLCLAARFGFCVYSVYSINVLVNT